MGEREAIGTRAEARALVLGDRVLSGRAPSRGLSLAVDFLMMGEREFILKGGSCGPGVRDDAGRAHVGGRSPQAELVVVRPFRLARVVDPVPMVLVLLELWLIPVL